MLPTIRPPLVALRYVTCFQFCGWRRNGSMARHVQMTIEYDQHVYTGGEVCCVRLFCSLMQFSEPNNTVSANGHRDIMITEICLYVCQSDCLCVCVCVCATLTQDLCSWYKLAGHVVGWPRWSLVSTRLTQWVTTSSQLAVVNHSQPTVTTLQRAHRSLSLFLSVCLLPQSIIYVLVAVNMPLTFTIRYKYRDSIKYTVNELFDFCLV